MRKLLNAGGVIILIILMIAVLPLTLPKIFGITPYNVLTGSMEPEIPVDSVIYVKKCDPMELQVEDVITFRLDSNTELVETHRIEEIDFQNALFTTKGDANKYADQTKVKAENIIGKVVFCIPGYGKFAGFINTLEGTAACIAVFAVVIIMWLVADRIKTKEM